MAQQEAYCVAGREQRREAWREKLRAEKQFNFAQIRMEVLMGKQMHVRWEGGHLEQYARPLSERDPRSKGLERLYPHAKPYPTITADDYDRYPCSHYPGLLEEPKRVVFANEKGRYPFSCVQHLPDVDDNDPHSIEARRSMERRAFCETVENKSWATTRVLGRCLQNPDNYPWPEQMVEHEGLRNKDPRNGKCSRGNWRWFWNRQSELICESPSPERSTFLKANIEHIEHFP
eukprot:4175464-Amphidinium_carterae.1